MDVSHVCMAQRESFTPRTIEAIDPDRDRFVRIFGTVIQKNEDSIMVDDGTGSLEVFLDAEPLKDLAEKQTVRIFGRILPTPDSFELQGEIVQDADGVDRDTYNTVMQNVQQ